MTNASIICNLISLLEGDTVTIVGGNIDTADLTRRTDHMVWTNNHWLKMRTAPLTMLFHCFGPRAPIERVLPELPADCTLMVGPDWAVGLHPALEWSITHPDTRLLTYGNQGSDSLWWTSLNARVGEYGGNTPLTGLVAAWFFHLMPIKSVFLTGMNLYQGQDLTAGMKSHNPVAQARMFNYILENDKRFTADSVMWEAVKELSGN